MTGQSWAADAVATNGYVTNAGSLNQTKTANNGVRHCPLDAKLSLYGVVLMSQSRSIYIHNHTRMCTTTGTPIDDLTSVLAEYPCEFATKCLAVGFPSLPPVLVKDPTESGSLGQLMNKMERRQTLHYTQMASWTPFIVVLI